MPRRPRTPMERTTRCSARRHAAGPALAIVIALAAATGGCAIAPPKPWEKDLLARPAMALEADPLEQRFLQHIYSSKENSSGGDGVGGGGCGCN